MARPEVLQELLGSCERVVQEIDSVSVYTPCDAPRGAAQEALGACQGCFPVWLTEVTPRPGRIPSLARRALPC